MSDARCFLDVLINNSILLVHKYVWIYENGAYEWKSRLDISWRFFLAPKATDIKNKRKVSAFFFLYPFISLALPFLLYFLPVYMAWKRPESWVKSP